MRIDLANKATRCLHLAILLSIVAVIGIYVIATTVLITEDGCGYIKMAQDFSENPTDVMSSPRPFGYPFLIFMAHTAVRFCLQNDSIYSWIYSAQSVTLLCRVLSLIPLYFIGRLLVGFRYSFWGLLILIMLPYPAKFGSDVIREWPHILFLATAMAFLIYGSRKGKWWMFAIAGLAAGLGHTIRAECAQVVIYGSLWLLIRLFIPSPNISRLKATCMTLILLIGFAIPAASYMGARERILPRKLKHIISCNTPRRSSEHGQSNINSTVLAYTTLKLPADILRALYKLIQQISAVLLYFFALPLVVGLYWHFRKLWKVLLTDRFFIFILVVLYMAMMVLLHINYGYIGRRHCMPMVVFTVFYIPVGLRVVARWIDRKTSKSNPVAHRNRQRWFFVLLAIGMTICIGKFARTIPLRWQKQGYLDAAKWLKENTDPEDIVAISPRTPRISFYAERTATLTQTYTSIISAGMVSSESWYHLVGTFDGDHQKLYINGTLAASKKTGFKALGTGHDCLAIGKPYSGADLNFKGIIDEVRLYGKALSSEEIEGLYNHQIPEVENGELIGYWPLEGDSPVVEGQSGEGMTFDGINDYIDLPEFNSSLDVDELTVSVRVKPEMLKHINWILGNGAQFRIGTHNSRVYFWIREKPPGFKIPAKAAYVALVKEGSTKPETRFNKSVQEIYSVQLNKREKSKRVVIYKVME